MHEMATCRICRKETALLSGELGLCLDCIRSRRDEVREAARKAGLRRVNVGNIHLLR